MKRKPLLIGLGVSLLLVLMLLYSLMGAMAGVYSCPAMTILDGSSGYLVRRENGWSVINIHGNLGDRVQPLGDAKVEIVSGIWVMNVIVREDGAVIRAIPPANVIDVIQLKIGKYRHLGR